MTDPELNFPTSDSYERFEDQRDHILNCPSMYIGSTEKIPYETDVYQDEHIVTKMISLPQGLERLFLEVLSNATDNVMRSRELKVNPGIITITMDNTTISLRNEGVPIPIEVHKKYKIYVPELIFGTLLSGSNYDKTKARTGTGVNGLGVKLVNIFSQKLSIDIGNHHQHQRYQQEWSNHMKVRSEPCITPYEGSSYVQVTYHLDFAYFKYTEYPQEAFALFAYDAINASFTTKIPVIFNEKTFDFSNIVNYAQLYNLPIENHLVHHQDNSKMDICILDTPDEGKCVSFVNGMITRDGGVHVNVVSKTIFSFILEAVNKSLAGKKDLKGRKKLTLTDIKPHLSFIISCWLLNPQCSGQMKSCLTSPVPNLTLPETKLNRLMKWNVINHLYAAYEAKQMKLLSKTDGRKRRHTAVAKLEDANEAGGKKSDQCSLFIVEGDSAMGFGRNLISYIPEGHDYFGLLPIKGKFLNVMNASFEQITNNKEIENLKSAIGLREGVDYTKDYNYKTLRYGRVILLTDADCDGTHIRSLLLLFFHCRFSSVLSRGMVLTLRTKTIEAKKGNQTEKFYLKSQFEEFVAKQGDNITSWKIKYYKGLGTHTKAEIGNEYHDNLRFVHYIYDDLTPKLMSLAFDEKNANLRKEWIDKYKATLGLEDIKQQPISHFIYNELIEYSLVNVSRSIPRLIDGLKESQRKVIWGLFLHWKKKNGQAWKENIKTGKVEQYKVGQLANFCAEKTNYHYNEKCLAETIVPMAQSFAGSNNMPYCIDDGQFGSRFANGADAGETRYIFTRPNWWLPYIYRNEDFPILSYRNDEGTDIEPVAFLAVIPMALVNGCNGIGTGYSTFIPSHHPLDLCQWILARLEDKPLPEIIPWFRGFKGKVEIVDRKRVKSHTSGESDKTPENETAENLAHEVLGNDEEDVSNSYKSLLITGLYEVHDNRTEITELPIGRIGLKYYGWLQKLYEEKLISDYWNQTRFDDLKFIIFDFKNPNLKTLHLQKSYGLSNMVLLTNDNKPLRFKSAGDLIEEFYQIRLPFYGVRKDYIITTLNEHIKKLENKVKFIRLVIDGKIKVLNERKDRIEIQMRAYELPLDLITTTTIKHCTYEDVEELEKERLKFIREREEIEKTSIKELWKKDLEDFIQAYREHYGQDR